MRNSRGFTSVAALGCLLVAALMMPALVQAQTGDELPDLRGTAPQRPQFTGTKASAGDETEAGIARVSKSSNMYLVDGAGASGTIYAYNYELRQIITSFPTPEPADGVSLDALAYASDRGTLYYTNAGGTGLIYELDAQTGAVIGTPFDGLLASGGRPNTGMGYGNIAGGSGIGLYFASIASGAMVYTDLADPTGILGGFGYGFAGNVGAELDAPGGSPLPPNVVYFQTDYPDHVGFDFDAGGFLPSGFFYGTYGTGVPYLPAGGLGHLIRTVSFGSFQQRVYTSTQAPDDSLYEYDSNPAASYFNDTLSSVVDPTPGAQVSAIGVGDADIDFDGLPDGLDTCPDVASTDFSDTDFDTIGDVCDNCIDIFNPGQEDGDFDGIGDVCDLGPNNPIIGPIPPLPVEVVWMTDGVEGGQIYEYDPATETILNTFPTPELNTGLGQGLAYAQSRASLFYTNNTTSTTFCSTAITTCGSDADCPSGETCGVKQMIYEISSQDGSILNILDPSTVTGRRPVGIGIGWVGGGAAGAVNATTLLMVEVPGPNVIRYRDPDTLTNVIGAGWDGDMAGQGAAAGTDDPTFGTPGAGDGFHFWTYNTGFGSNAIEALTLDPFATWDQRFIDVDGPAGQTNLGMGFDGTTFYVSNSIVDGLYTYTFADLDSDFATPMGISCLGSTTVADGTPCVSDAECDDGTCVRADQAPQPDGGFLADPTPGQPVTGVAAGHADFDRDGVQNSQDNCPTFANSQQEDNDLDGLGDACDNCPDDANAGQEESELLDNFDGVGDVCDNCPFLFNPNQEDDNGNGIGNPCDPPPGFVDDSDADDNVFGPDNPPVPSDYDIKQFETSVDFCDFSCSGGADVCCGRTLDDGEPALIVNVDVIGADNVPKLTGGFYDVFFDYGEGDSCTGLSIKDAPVEPGVCEDTSDIRMSARFSQSLGRGRIEPTWQANANLNNELGKLSTVNQVEASLSFVLPVAALIDKANAAQKAASGLDTDPLGEVEYALWAAVGSQNLNEDRAPNTDDNLTPTITEEVTIFTAYFNEVTVAYPGFPANPLSFDGALPCQGGDGDRVVVGTGTATSFLTLVNPSFQPMTVTDFIVDDPQFAVPVSLPITLAELGGTLPIGVSFSPSSEGPQMANVTIVSADPTPTVFQLAGTGYPNDAPVLPGACDINPSTVFLGQAPIFTVEASDTATLANITQCLGRGVRIAGGPPTQVILDLDDDGSSIGDVACDGTFTDAKVTGGLFGRGTWEFTFECADRQGNSSGALVCPVQLTVQ